jgi:hypothetical protein
MGVSIPVDMQELRNAVAARPPLAYVLTVADDGRPHSVHAPVAWRGDSLAVQVGRRTAANAAARPSVSLLYPVRDGGDYSLIVDGTAAVATDAGKPCLLITPTKAVLHRPAADPNPTASACGAHCVPLFPEPPRPRVR